MSRVVDIVIPVYGNFSDAERAIDAAIVARNKTDANIVVIDDASPQTDADAFFSMISERPGVTLIRNPENLGFAATVNLGMQLHGDRHVALLNSDTLVFDGWLDRLMRVLLENPRAATATPMSNAATILSYPRWLIDNSEPLEIGWRELDALCAQLAPAPQPIPTGVGFCMLIRRETLDDVGYFDHEVFGRGYGEETDFCLRAAEAGWTNFAALNTFVWHRGAGTFGVERLQKCAQAQEIIEQRHPGYAAAIGRYIAAEPMREIWASLDALRIRSCGRRRSLVIGLAGPAEEEGLQLELIPRGRFWRRLWRLAAPDFGILPNLPTLRSDTCKAELKGHMTDLGIESVHIVKPRFGARVFAKTLAEAATELNVPCFRD